MNFAVGDVVLELDKNLHREQWNIGHITKIFPGEDGLVRVVDVQLFGVQFTGTGSTDREISDKDVPANSKFSVH